LSGVTLSVPFLARLAREVPQVCYFKIEVPGAAAKLRALIAAGGAARGARVVGGATSRVRADVRVETSGAAA
jgi:4-hydroxy-tetrahydrodipicolinate synthase